MTNFNTIDEHFNSLTDIELQEVNGGSLLLLGAIGIGATGLVIWGFYNGYQSAARGG